MRRVILTAGPRGAGKTTFCKKVVEARPEIVLIERDAILIEMFGRTDLCPYTGGHQAASSRMMTLVKETLKRENITLILDTWNGYAEERRFITDKLFTFDVDRIDLWLFTTPRRVCVRQFISRSRIEQGVPQGKNLSDREKLMYKLAAESSHRHYHLYHSQPFELDQGFTSIVRINPAEQTLFPLIDLVV